MNSDTRPLAERVRDIAEDMGKMSETLKRFEYHDRATHYAGLAHTLHQASWELQKTEALTLHEAADALEARKDQP